MKLPSALIALVYPPRCPFCGRLLERGEEGLCAQCQRALPWTPEQSREVDFCEACLAPLWYREGVVRAVRRYKFGHGRGHEVLLGGLMAQCLGDRWDQEADGVVWVPLSADHLRRRGYDQAELLARQVGKAAGLPALPALEKVRATGTQSDLREDAARRANVSGAYRVREGVDVAGLRLILVDDVVTSGATLSECAAVLRMAGAQSVVGLTLARAR